MPGFEVYNMTTLKRLNGFYLTMDDINIKATKLFKSYMKKHKSTNPRIRTMQARMHIIIRGNEICIGGGRIRTIGYIRGLD